MTVNSTPAPEAARTLVIDVGGTGLKATVLDPDGRPLHDRVRRPTCYPCPPERLVADLVALTAGLPDFERVSAGFPGVVRNGRVVTAPHFVTEDGPGTRVDDRLVRQWAGFGLRSALGRALNAPVRVANDADVQGAGVISGHGLELVLTLGTGLGSTVFRDGRLALHLELAHHPAGKTVSYNDYIGDSVRKELGNKKWNARVRKALLAIDELVSPDTILIGGGNARRVDTGKLGSKLPALAAKVSLVGNDGGLLGGIALWSDIGLD